MPTEVYEQFRSLHEWNTWISHHQADTFSAQCSRALLDALENNGLEDPLTTVRYTPQQITIANDNFRETIRSGPLISRHRALLVELRHLAQSGRKHLVTRKCKVYAPEALTDFALYMRGIYPKFVGSEFAMANRERQELFPILSEDLHALSFPAEAFDLVVANDVFEHLHDLDRALREIFRVLDESGVLIATFPFLSSRENSLPKARLVNGVLEYLTTPEYHGNPLRPDEGSLVFEIPAWDMLTRARSAGFEDAYFSFVSSAKHGVIGRGINGVHVFVASRNPR